MEVLAGHLRVASSRKRKIRFKTLLQYLFLVTILLIYLSFIFADANIMLNFESMVYLSILAAVMMFTVVAANRFSFPVLLVLLIYTYQRYLLSGFPMIFSGGNGLMIFENYRGYSVNDYNVCLRYAILGYTAVAMGLIIGVSDVPFKLRMAGLKDLLKDSSTKKLSALIILYYFLAISLITLYNYYFGGARYVGIQEADDGSPLRLFLNFNIVIILSISILFFRSEILSKRDKYILYSIMFISLLLSIQAGSRSYLYNIFVNYILIFLVIRNGNYRVRFNWKLITLVVLAAVIVYPIATIMRYKEVLEDVGVNKDELFNQSIDYFYGGSGDQVDAILISIFQRINSFETSLMIMNDRNVLPYDQLLSFPYVLGRTINNIFPGDPLGDLILPQYLFDHIYYNRFAGWNAYDWGLWEEFYLIFGYWGGIITLFFFMSMMGYLWRRLLLSRSKFKLFYIGTFVYFFLQRLLVNYEISLVISSVLLHILIFHILYVGLTTLNSLFGLKPMEGKN